MLAEGDEIRAGGRDLRVVARPGHSTTDTLFVDDRAGLALVGDHLLAGVSSNTEIYARMSEDIDIDCGAIATGHTSVADKGAEILDYLLKVASGEASKSEALGYGGSEFVPWIIGATM